MEFPSRVAQKLIRLTRSLYPARSDKPLVGRAKARLGSRKSRGFNSGFGGDGPGNSEGGRERGREGGRRGRAKGMPMLKGAARDRAILRARDYKPLFPRRPLSQIYPSSPDTHLPPSPPSGSSFFVFLIRNFVTSSSRPAPLLPPSSSALSLRRVCLLLMPHRKFHPLSPPFS